MARFYHYHIQLTDGGQKIRVTASDPKGDVIYQPRGTCSLSEVPPCIDELKGKVVQGTATPAEMDELGEELYRALLPAEISSHFRDLLDQATQEDAFLRLELDLDEAELAQIAALPWEFLRAPQTASRPADNLGVHPRLVLSRRRALWRAAAPIQLADPLSIQLAVSAPTDLGPVVYDKVETALQELAQQLPGQIAPLRPVLHGPNATSLERALEEGRPQALHFIGHGRLRKVRGAEFGELALVSAMGNADWWADEDLGELFQFHTPALVLLQACQSGAAGSAEAFVGVASQIVQRNVPVVVAMQYPISNAVAVAFAQEFYRIFSKNRGEPHEIAHFPFWP